VRRLSEGIGTNLSGADADHLFNRRHEDLAIAGLAGCG